MSDFLFPEQPHPGDGAIEPLVGPLKVTKDLSWRAHEVVIRKMLRAACDAGAASRPQANKRARRYLPNDLFPLVARYYWSGEPSR